MQRTLLFYATDATAAAATTTAARATRPSVLGATYRVDATHLPQKTVDAHVKALTMMPKGGGGGFAPEPEPFDAYTWDAATRTLGVPRFYGLASFGLPDVDERLEGVALGEAVRFASTLNSGQTEAHDATLRALRETVGGGALLVRKPGGGKTVLALALAAALGRRTLVFSHKTDLLDQWRERIEQHLPGATVGRIQQHRVDVEADVVLATLQSVALRDYDPALFSKFGLAIFDEAHHMGARHFFRVLSKVRPTYLLGLTATPERRDGLTELLYQGIGPVAHRDAGTDMERVHVTRLVYTGGTQREIKVRGMPCVPLMIGDLVKDLRRTRLIADRVRALYADGRHTIVLSHQIAHLHDICRELLTATTAPAANGGGGAAASSTRALPEEAVGYYIGSTPAKQRALVRVRPVILATYSMAKEGLDIGRLDAEVLATPLGDVEQAVGRIQRPCADKQAPVLVDVVDPFSIFQHTARKRKRFYESKNFEIVEDHV